MNLRGAVLAFIGVFGRYQRRAHSRKGQGDRAIEAERRTGRRTEAWTFSRPGVKTPRTWWRMSGEEQRGSATRDLQKFRGLRNFSGERAVQDRDFLHNFAAKPVRPATRGDRPCVDPVTCGCARSTSGPAPGPLVAQLWLRPPGPGSLPVRVRQARAAADRRPWVFAGSDRPGPLLPPFRGA